MDKIKLNAKETANLTRIKIDDIHQIIKDVNYVLDEFYYDKQIAYLPNVVPSPYVNPVQDIYKLIETIELVLNKYEKNEWEKDNEFDRNENRELYDALFGLRQSLYNSFVYARDNSQFKEQYNNWNKAYNTNMENSAFLYGKEKLTNKIEEEAGWVPTYHNGKIDYSYYTDYYGQKIPLDNIERDDGKQTLSPEMVKEQISRGF